ncbi:MAG TPA: GIY-YIG nuclease family protein [Devosia sp.]|nr:GIY-YIG nuclease family protein [Devosia sp.]
MKQASGDAVTRPVGRSVSLFLTDGTAHGIVVAGIGNWSGKVLAGPRGRLPELMRRPEAERTGIYVLLGPDPERPGDHLVYIGEADNIAKRIRTHLGDVRQDFFDRVAFIVTADGSLTKGPVRYLESRLIRLALEAGSITLTNDRHPDFRLLPEADRADMETFIDHMKLALPLLGFDLFRSGATAGPPNRNSDRDEDSLLFTFSTGGATARARETEDGFVVLAGSTARRLPSGTFPAGYRALRDRFIEGGQLTDAPSPDLMNFATDVTFTSPSAAASIVAARSASGPIEWKLEGSGQSYRDWKAASLASQEGS